MCRTALHACLFLVCACVSVSKMVDPKGGKEEGDIWTSAVPFPLQYTLACSTVFAFDRCALNRSPRKLVNTCS